jgi:hypothetical protein
MNVCWKKSLLPLLLLGSYGCKGLATPTVPNAMIQTHQIKMQGTISSDDNDPNRKKLDTEPRTVPPFTAIAVSSGIQVKFVEMTRTVVNVSANQTDLANISTTVENGVLVIDEQGDSTHHGPATVVVGNPHLSKVTLEGAAGIDAQQLDDPSLEVTATGRASVMLAGSVGNLKLSLNEATRMLATLTGKCRLSGNCDGGSIATITAPFSSVDFEASDAGKLGLNGLLATSVQLKGSGGSKIECGGKADSLTVDATGAAHFDLAGLRAQDGKIIDDEGGSIDLDVVGTLVANVSNGSRVVYRKKPRNLVPTVESGGQILQK